MARRITFDSQTLSQRPGKPLAAGQAEGVHFIFSSEYLDWLLGVLAHWFGDRDDITLVAYGKTAGEDGFIVMEWDGTRIDPDFITALSCDTVIMDYSRFTREPAEEPAPQQDNEADDQEWEDDEEDDDDPLTGIQPETEDDDTFPHLRRTTR